MKRGLIDEGRRFTGKSGLLNRDVIRFNESYSFSRYNTSSSTLGAPRPSVLLVMK